MMADFSKPFFIQKGNIYAVPILHYNRETTVNVKKAFNFIQPDCVAVELAETLELQLLHAASRLPDLSVVITQTKEKSIYYLCEPCEGTFEGLRSGLEKKISVKCIDLDVDQYPSFHENFPDPYAISRIGLEAYYDLYKKESVDLVHTLDAQREMYMARRLKELSFSYEKILFIGGMAHIERILQSIDKNVFPSFKHVERENTQLCTLSEKSAREVMAEFGWITLQYEDFRQNLQSEIDRQKDIYHLYVQAGEVYKKNTGNPFLNYHLRNTMKFVRNYALISNALIPNLYQILSAAKSCVDHNYAYEVWLLATNYPFLKNIDNLQELDLTIEEVWGNSKIIRFHKKLPNRKGNEYLKRKKDKQGVKFEPPNPFTLCSYPPEDGVVENFGRFLQKKTIQLLNEESAKIVPFTSSIEDGIDTRETIRHWYEKKLYVRQQQRKNGAIGSVVVIFDEDIKQNDEQDFTEKYPWKLTWNGEHSQESDMAFYATSLNQNVIGPGICRCEYGGFMMSYPPRRMLNIWTDPDYFECKSKPEILLLAAIDYAIHPLITYVGPKPPRSYFKSFAAKFGKKIFYIPLSQLSPITINKIRSFHVLDGSSRRNIADEYIF